jgi:hypothetical protein
MNLQKSLLIAASLAVLATGPALAQRGATAKGASSAAPAASAAPTGSALPPSSATPAATSSATTATAGAMGTAVAAPLDGQTYTVRLRDLEQRVDELKEQIRRSHTRLSLLSETILSTSVQGSRAEIVFQNDMSSAFRLIRALVVLDGAVQYNKADDTGALGEQTTIPILSGALPPGDHTLQVLLQFQGNGYGVFSYLKGYKFDVRSTHSFRAVEGKTISLQVIAYEKGGVTTPLEQRPQVRYFEKVTTGLNAASPPPAAAPATSASPISTGISIGTGNP